MTIDRLVPRLRGMRFLWILVIVAHLIQSPLVFCQQRPLVTERVETVRRGYLLADVGAEFLQDAVFPLSGLEGDLTRVGAFGVRMGAGEIVELQMLGVLQDILNVEQSFPAPNSARLNFSGNSTSDFGDLTFATKVRLSRGQGARPSFGLRFGAQLPNASNESGLGNDETNAFASLLLEKNLGKLTLLSNLGIVILGDPIDGGAQDDLFSYGLAALYPMHPRVRIIADAYGRLGSGGIGTEEQSRFRLGTQIVAGSLNWDLALFLGFRDTDPSTGILLGVSKELKLPALGF